MPQESPKNIELTYKFGSCFSRRRIVFVKADQRPELHCRLWELMEGLELENDAVRTANSTVTGTHVRVTARR